MSAFFNGIHTHEAGDSVAYDGIFEQLKADTLYCQMQAPARAAAPKRMRRRCLASPLQSVKPVSQDAEQ
jgi:hypothetical protein